MTEKSRVQQQIKSMKSDCFFFLRQYELLNEYIPDSQIDVNEVVVYNLLID